MIVRKTIQDIVPKAIMKLLVNHVRVSLSGESARLNCPFTVVASIQPLAKHFRTTSKASWSDCYTTPRTPTNCLRRMTLWRRGERSRPKCWRYMRHFHRINGPLCILGAQEGQCSHQRNQRDSHLVIMPVLSYPCILL